MKSDRELYKLAIEKWGISSQVFMAIEEMAELTKALSKYNRCPNKLSEALVIDEIADVEIMLEQIKEIIYCHDRVREQKKHKLYKLENLLSE